MVVFSDAKEELFKTDLFKILISGYWSDLSNMIIITCFIPFFLFFLINTIYFSYYLEYNKNEEN